MTHIKIIIIGIVATVQISFYADAQQRITQRGTSQFRKVGVHRGNQVRTVFSNYGVLAQPGSEGPRGAWKYDANAYVGDISPLVGLRMPVADYRQGTTPPDGILDTLHAVIITPVDRPGAGKGTGGKFWGFEPIPGFANPTLDEVGKGIAMSQLPETWPPSWPDRPDWVYSGKPVIVGGADVTPKVDWNGYFGRGQFNADQESYYWMDDFNDVEFQDRYGIIADSTNPSRTGHAIQVSVRGLQWSNFLAQDVLFVLYNITNDGTSVYDQATFGALVGTYVGGADPEWNDDASFFNVREAITYTWDYDHYISPAANPQWMPNPTAVGYVAYAFLESPGNPYDGIDNDGDNAKYPGNAPFFAESDFLPKTVKAGQTLVLIDKKTFKRSLFTMPNDTVTVVSMGVPFFLKAGETVLAEGNINTMTGDVNSNARDGIDNDLDGLIDENYQLHYRQFKKAKATGTVLIDTLAPVQYVDYIAGRGANDRMIDEKRDDSVDNDGDWNAAFDDVGADGVAGTRDTGEGDGVPTAGEPNFDATDVHESDQIGLTSFEYFTPATDITMSNNEDMWRRLTPGFFDVPTSVVNNVATRGEDGDFIYGSGYFPLLPGKTERFSLALAFGEDFSAVLKAKQVAQLIYNANYNFPRPPVKPTLTAVPGNGKVTLYWDKIAESSVDPVLKIKDFEGYKIYKGTDPDFTDALQISDGSGSKIFYAPLVQYDVNNEYAGYFSPSNLLRELTNGAPFYLGSNTGIQNTFVDKDVVNGRTYYYAVVAYDRGDPSKDIFPSENTKFISKDALGRISTDVNTAAVIPNAPVAGYAAPKSGLPLTRSNGNSSAVPYFEVIDPLKVKGAVYDVSFNDSLVQGIRIAYSFNVKNSTSGNYVIRNGVLLPSNGDVFEGVRLSIDTSYQQLGNITLDTARSGWSNRNQSNLRYLASQFTSTVINGKKRPNDYAVVFSNSYSDSSNKLTQLFGSGAPPAKRVNFRIYDMTDPVNPQRIQFAFTEASAFRRDTLSFLDQLTLSNATGTEITWKIVMTGDSSSLVPQQGDTLFLKFRKPFDSDDLFTFTAPQASYDGAAARNQMGNIKVVPNPYIVTNIFEQPLPPNVRGRGERVINFVNLPPNCQIHIYSSSGKHIRSLQHDGQLIDGSVSWDVRTKEGLDVATGVYFYIVEAEGIAEKKKGKIAIVK